MSKPEKPPAWFRIAVLMGMLLAASILIWLVSSSGQNDALSRGSRDDFELFARSWACCSPAKYIMMRS